jgi:tetratricopeptide (TPR) repeat protein
MIFPIIGASIGLVFVAGGLRRKQERAVKPPSPPVESPVAAPAPAAKAISEARQFADKAFGMSVDKYDSTLDDFALADTLMQKALALDSADGEILARSAQLHLMFRNRGFDYSPERVNKGREQAERAVRLVPESAEAWYALALAQRYTGNSSASMESMEKVITFDPLHARALLMLGSGRITRGKEEEGLAFYARARQQAQWAPLADYYEFLRRFGRREFAEAERLIRSSYRLGASANNAAGIALIHLSSDGDLEAAARELADIPNKLITAPRVVCVTAFVHLGRRKPDEALKVLDRLAVNYVQDAWSTGPKDAWVGRAHALAGRTTAARLAWQAALEVVEARLKTAPGESAYHHDRGQLLAWLGRADEALQEARTVEELNLNASPGWNGSAATIYAALGRADLAVPLIEKLLAEKTINWPLTTTLLRLDPLWDPIRNDPGFQRLLIEQTPPREWPLNAKLKKAFEIITAIDTSVESCRLAEDIVNAELKERPADAEATILGAMVSNYMINRGYDISEERFVAARRFSDRALQLAPEDPEALAAMAQFLSFRKSDVARAEELIRKAIALAPAEPRFSRILVYNVLYGTRNEDAVVEAKAARLRFPKDPLTHYNLALISRLTGDIKLMEECLDASIALAPVGSALIWKGWLTAWIHGDLPGFKTWLDRISGNFRTNERAIYMRYVYACLSGEANYGLQAVQSYSGSWMNDFYYNGPTALLAADLLAMQGRQDLAREEYERALAEIRRVAAANPGDRSADRAELWVLLGLGRTEEARAAARKLCQQQTRPFLPVYTIWWHHVIAAELLTGNRTEALALMREGARLAAFRDQMRVALKIDPRMAPFRDDPEIQAILATPADAAATPNPSRATAKP